jgi:GNAT superfamily N-acetyltransferase
MRAFQPVILSGENGLAFRPYIVAEHFNALLKEGNRGVGLLTEDGRAAGAIVCAREGDALVINSIFVDESVRGQGAGALLVDNAKALSHKLGTALCARYAYPEQREMDLFFRKMGFIGPEDGNVVFSVPLETIRNCDFLRKDFPEADRMLPFHELPKRALLDYGTRIGKDIPAFADMERAPGTPIPEATLACLHDGRICSFIVSTVSEDGSLCLYSLYSEKSRAKNLYVLIQAALRALCERGGEGDALHVAAHNEAGLKIIEHLLREAPGEALRNTVRSMVFRPIGERSVTEMEEIDKAIPVLDMLMPKLSGLSELMRELGIENDLLVPADTLPYIATRADVGAEAVEIQLVYVPTDEEDAGKYVLTATAALPLSDTAASAVLLCDHFNANTLGPFAHSDPEGEVIYIRSNLPEKDLPTPQALFEYSWELLNRGIAEMTALMNEETV